MRMTDDKPKVVKGMTVDVLMLTGDEAADEAIARSAVQHANDGALIVMGLEPVVERFLFGLAPVESPPEDVGK